MHHIELRWGSKCRIYQARMRDPYTGRKLTWRRDGYRIQIDHVYPLSTRLVRRRVGVDRGRSGSASPTTSTTS